MSMPETDETGRRIASQDNTPPLESLASRTATLVTPCARVLLLGCTSCASLLELLDGRGCHVTVIADPNAAIAGDGVPHGDRIIRGTLDQTDVRQQLRDERFNAVILGDSLAASDNPALIITLVPPFLTEGG
jgi:hypothetical protein